jgi:Domain of unknown function (DUF5658)
VHPKAREGDASPVQEAAESRVATPESAPGVDRMGPYASWPYVDRRHGPDRRTRGTKLWSRFLLWGGSRLAGRRKGERDNIYVDRYERRDLMGVVVILVLNILDAWLTLLYLGYGGSEANPIARKLLEWGTEWFLGAKSLLVTACLLFLAVHKTFRCVRPALRVLTWFYGGLLGYHLVLQARAIIPALAA